MTSALTERSHIPIIDIYVKKAPPEGGAFQFSTKQSAITGTLRSQPRFPR